MTISTFYQRSISIVATILALLLAIVSVNDIFDVLRIDLSYRKDLLYVSGILIVALLLLLVLYSLKKTGEALVKFTAREYDLSLHEAEIGDIESISRVAQDLFGANVSGLEKNIQLHSFDSRIFTPVKDDKRRLCGYICLIRLSAKGVKAIENNNFWFSHLPLDYLRTDRVRDPNIYVGAIYGKNPRAKAFALGSTMMLLREIKPKRVYARAATADGIRILTKHGFKPLFGKVAVDELFVREFG